MKTALRILVVSTFAGCMSAAPKPPVCWTIEGSGGMPRAPAAADAEDAKLLQVSVRAPYDAREFAILRADGSVAFDSFNRFAAAPASLLKGAALDILESSGRFARVLPGTSSAKVPLFVEISVDELALDCRGPDGMAAVAKVTLATMRGRDIEYVSRGEGRSPAGAGEDFSRAFSNAFAAAVDNALGVRER